MAIEKIKNNYNIYFDLSKDLKIKNRYPNNISIILY